MIYQHHNQSGLSASPARINIDRLILLVKQGPESLLDLLDLLLLSGSMPTDLRLDLIEHINSLAGETQEPAEMIEVDDAIARQQVLDSLFVILASPAYMVQR